MAHQKMSKRGDISARSAMTIHRGTVNRSNRARPVLVIGLDATDARNAERRDLQLTRDFYERLPADLQENLTCRLVDRVERMVQGHTIEGS